MYKIIMICENAINFSSIEEAKALIRRERDIGNTISKFQLFNKENITNPAHRDYCLKRMLSKEDAEELFLYGRSINQPVFFTCMQSHFVKWCEDIGVDFYKIRYYDRYNQNIIKEVIKTEKDFFISCDYKDDFSKFKHSIPLYCIPKYPSFPYQYKNIFEDKKSFQGLSDHCKGLKLLKKAWNEGFRYHERHVMLDNIDILEEKWACSLTELNRTIKNLIGTTKVCSQCNEEKKFSEFHYEKKKGYRSNCSKCQNKASKNWYDHNKPYRFQYLEERREHYKELNKNLREKNKEKRNKQIKDWHDRQVIQATGIKSLAALHRYVRRRKEEPLFCNICNEKKKLDLASITHIYTRNPDDYIYLCRSCHPIYELCRKTTEAPD